MAFLNDSVTVSSVFPNSSTVSNLSMTPILHMPALLKVNAVIARKLIPVTILLWFYLIIGTLGNALVIIVYWTQKKPVREDQYLIPFLALVDLASCIVSAGSGIHAQNYPLIFDNDAGCKAAAFLGIAFAGLSADMLLLIAVERYLKLCRPFGRQMTIFAKKVAMVVVLVVSILLAAPALDIYASEEIPVKAKGLLILGWKCMDIKDKKNVILHMVYKAGLFVVTLIRLLALVVFYGKIVKTIVQHGKYRLRLRSSISTSGSVSNSHTADIPLETADTQQQKEANGSLPQNSNKTSKESDKNDPFIKPSLSERLSAKRKQSMASISSSTGRRPSVVDQQGIRLTIIFILITFIYFITYCPKVGLMIAQTMNKHFWSTIPLNQLGIYRFLHTIFIFNNVVNPIIYALMDKCFRNDFKKRFTKCA